jgi:UPF0716 family protein affecting phage T7 exclusion
VETRQIVFGVVIVVATAAIGAYFAWRQGQTLRRLRADRTMPDDERTFQRNSAWRRLAGSILLLIFAVSFVGMFFLEGPASELVRQGAEAKARSEGEPGAPQPQLDPSQKAFLRLYGGYWIVLLLLVLVIIALAGYELYAIRRYSVQHLRRIQDERRAMIASETARIRRERNGAG